MPHQGGLGGKAGLPGLRVLVAEDDPVIRRLLTKVAEECASTVAVAQNLRDALALLREEALFQLALVDCNLPDGHGEVVARAATTEPRAGNPIQVVAISSDDSLAIAERMYRAGASLSHQAGTPGALDLHRQRVSRKVRAGIHGRGATVNLLHYRAIYCYLSGWRDGLRHVEARLEAQRPPASEAEPPRPPGRPKEHAAGTKLGACLPCPPARFCRRRSWSR